MVPAPDDSLPLRPGVPDRKAKIIARLRRLAKKLRTEYVSRTTFLKRSGVSSYQVDLLFGSYNGLLEAAGMVARPARPFEGQVYSTDQVLAELLRVLRLPDAKPTALFFKRHSQRSLALCAKRFGSWTRALQAASAKLDPQQDAALLARIGAHLAQQNRAADRRAQQRGATRRPAQRSQTAWQRPPLNAT
jgi:hypothetical protein